MLEAAVRNERINLTLMAENLLMEEERLLSEKDSVVTTVISLMASELRIRLKKPDYILWMQESGLLSEI